MYWFHFLSTPLRKTDVALFFKQTQFFIWGLEKLILMVVSPQKLFETSEKVTSRKGRLPTSNSAIGV